MNTLEKKSKIWPQKLRFFLYRAVTYFSFLLFPIWIPKGIELAPPYVGLLMTLYILFMSAQWFLLGKEIDHRLKIYFRVNSSIDRVVYRVFLGMFFMALYSNLLALLPGKWIYNCFWITWAAQGLFYSWPTRGKIIQESMSSNLTEFKFLDAFEKTLLGLILIVFAVSLPELPSLANIGALKLYFDPTEKFSPQFWNFLTVNYYPFMRYPSLIKMAWSLHFYLVGMGLYLITFYAFLRFFVSRRLSMLGVFALVSSWSWPKLLSHNFGDALTTTYSLLWIWTFLWVSKSSTYRAGLFMGLVGAWGVLLNHYFIFLMPLQMLLLHFYFLEDKTDWFKRQLIKYNLLGVILASGVYLLQLDTWGGMPRVSNDFFGTIQGLIERKAFYSLCYLGLLFYLVKMLFPDNRIMKSVQLDLHRLRQLGIGLLTICLYGLVADISLVSSFAFLWVVVLFSLFPIELVFQSINRLRSGRNMIYLVYIVICLLDSHFEGRVKIFLQIFK